MRAAHPLEQIRAAEAAALAGLRSAGRDDGELMQRAAAGAAAVALALLGGAYGRRVLLVAGAGNNGGDGLFAAVRLARRGVAVDTVAVADGLHGGGSAALARAGGRVVDPVLARSRLASGGYDLVIDAVLGIGGRRGLRGAAAAIAAAVGDTPVLAIDLPSGLVADAPGVDGEHFRATVTATFGARKLCQLAEPAASACGDTRLFDLGFALGEPALLQWEPDDVAAALPVPGPQAQKYSRGVLGLDVGSPDYPGAGVLAHLGAAHAGLGMLRSLGSAAVAEAVVAALPNVVRADGRVQARLLGSGWGERPDAAPAVARAIAAGEPLVLDADALTVLPDRLAPHTLLTPHAGELARLLGVSRGEVEADPLGHARRAADRTGATVLLKGAAQYVAEPGSAVVHQAVPGPAWTAQAGSGDVLAGLCAGLLAAGLNPREAAATGASLQALTAAANPGPRPPQDIARRVPATIARLVGERTG